MIYFGNRGINKTVFLPSWSFLLVNNSAFWGGMVLIVLSQSWPPQGHMMEVYALVLLPTIIASAKSFCWFSVNFVLLCAIEQRGGTDQSSLSF